MTEIEGPGVRVRMPDAGGDLPPQLTSFVGRESELLEVQKLLAEHRLVTVAGPGGCGKTRLAMAAAEESAQRWADGLCWVDLGAISDPALVTRAVAAEARVLVDPVGDPRDALVAQLRHQRLLLCLDTCEHLLQPCAELVDVLLRGCPDLSVLVTSRERLGVGGEAVWRVPPLAVEQAMRLFADRAALVRSDYTGGGAAERAVCARLDGIPLAIELAAARVRVVSVDDISARLADRFRLLTGGPRIVADRHRSIEASLTWSHDLLDETDRVLFRRLAVFAGGFDIHGAAAVHDDGPDVLDAVGRLIDKSLIVATDAGGAVRYRMLDTIREYAQDRLQAAGETAAMQDRHLDHFLGFAEAAETGLERDGDRWRPLVAAELDNLRAALHRGLAAADPERGRRLAAALGRFWFVCGYTEEGMAFLERAIALGGNERTPLQAALLAGMAWTATGSGRFVLSAAMAEQGIEIAAAVGASHQHARCLVLAASGRYLVDVPSMYELAREGGDRGAAAGDAVAVEYSAILRARAFTNRDRHAEALAELGDTRGRALARGDRAAAALLHGVQVWAALFTGDVRGAVGVGREALALAEPLADFFTVGHMACNLAWATGLAGDLDGAQALISPVLRSVGDTNAELLRWFALFPGRLELWRGDLDAARRWLETAALLAAPTTDNGYVAQALAVLAAALRRLGQADESRAAAERASALAEALDMPHVRAEALDELGHLARADGRPAQAADLHHQALALRVGHDLRTFWPDSLDAVAGIVDDPVAAVRLLAAAEAGRSTVGRVRPPVDRDPHEATVTALRVALGPDAFAGAWSAGTSLTLEDAVAYAVRGRGGRGRPASGWASLTPTESRVVELVVAGRSNPDIGAQLFMSLSTVKTHLAHVYAKLGVANRAELAAMAGRRQAGST